MVLLIDNNKNFIISRTNLFSGKVKYLSLSGLFLFTLSKTHGAETISLINSSQVAFFVFCFLFFFSEIKQNRQFRRSTDTALKIIKKLSLTKAKRAEFNN